MHKKPFVISIASVSGGGKTAVTHALTKRHHKAKAIYFDEYNLEGPSNFSEWVERGGDYNEWNVNPIRQDIQKLLQNSTLNYIILDYPFSYLNTQLNDFINLSIYLDTPLDIALIRRFFRSKVNSIEEIRFEFENYMMRGRNAYIVMEGTIKPSADFIVDGLLSVNDIVDNIINKLATYEHKP